MEGRIQKLAGTILQVHVLRVERTFMAEYSSTSQKDAITPFSRAERSLVLISSQGNLILLTWDNVRSLRQKGEGEIFKL